MCYAIPGKLVGMDGNIGTVDYFGEKRKVLLDSGGARVGDYVYAQGGVFVRRITEREAEEVLAAWKDIFFELKKIDEGLSMVKSSRAGVSIRALDILEKANSGKPLTREDIVFFVGMKSRKGLKLLCDSANNIRHKENGNACCVHGILEFSNVCGESCLYCGIRKERDIKRYRMAPDEIVDAAAYAVTNLGFKAVVLQSGEDTWYDEEKLSYIVRKIKKLGVLIFLSIGSREHVLYEKLFRAGARAALLRFETSNEALFNRLRPGTSLDERVGLIRSLKKMGYVTATGFLFGFRGETPEDIADDIMFAAGLEPDMYSFGPFMHSGDRGIGVSPRLNKDLALKVIALTRLVDRKAKILATTALETLDGSARKEGLMAGANSLMINITPAESRELYAIYGGRAGSGNTVDENIKETLDLLASIGRAPADIGI